MKAKADSALTDETTPKEAEPKRVRKQRPYPSGTFENTLELANAIQLHASGGEVRRLTLLEKMGKSPTSSATRDLITNSSKYGITAGSYTAESLTLTSQGSVASDPTRADAARKSAQFELGIRKVEPFAVLFDAFVGKRLPSHEVMRDLLLQKVKGLDDPRECVDLFVVNAKFLGLLRNIGGVETLVAVEDAFDSSSGDRQDPNQSTSDGPSPATAPAGVSASPGSVGQVDWENLCFFIAPIGSDGSDERKHSDLFLRQIVEPALAETLTVIRADEIDASGLITSQVIEYLAKARLVVADLSYHNPNVFYELALRHAVRKPVVHIIRKSDRIPFDINQARMIQIDTTDIYSLVPQIETYRSQIATFAKAALAADETSSPLELYYPSFWDDFGKMKR